MWDKNLDKAVGKCHSKFSGSLRQLTQRNPHRTYERTSTRTRRSIPKTSTRLPWCPTNSRARRPPSTKLVQVRVLVSNVKSRTRLLIQSILLGATSLSVVTVYPLMKRLTHWPQAVLGLVNRLVHLPAPIRRRSLLDISL
jgi:hypothetical protein